MRCGHMWVEFISGSRLCYKWFFYGCAIFSSILISAIPHSNSVKNVAKEEPVQIIDMVDEELVSMVTNVCLKNFPQIITDLINT